jgi:uncharacterized membrane protein YdjX (TVP38/TMEM64 family)
MKFFNSNYSEQKFKYFFQSYGLKKYLNPKRILFLSLFIYLVVTLMRFRFKGYLTPEIIFNFINGFTFMAPIVFILIYIVFMCFMLPTLPLNIGAGFLWGPVWGSMITIIGCGLGLIGAFGVARISLGGFLTLRFDNRIIVWLQNEIDKNGWKVVAFTRINPVFPTGAINFLFGMTSIRFSTYLWSSMAFLAPFIIIFAVIGSEVNGFVLRGEITNWLKLVFIVSSFVTLACFCHIAKIVYNSDQK